MEEDILKYIKSKQTKLITLSEIYTSLKLPYNPETDKMLFKILNELVAKNILEPIKSSSIAGNYRKYKIIKQDTQKNIKEEIINSLSVKIDISYLLKHPNEYEKNKNIIQKISEFLKNPDTNILTVNERSYSIFRDEKKLKENEEILKKLNISYADLYCYYTYEPFFYYENPKAKENEILIIENKDTFWTLKSYLPENFAMIIYGEGKKILSSFEYLKELHASKQIAYFGDIDYEGINIYISLKEKYPDYNIQVYKKGYETILNLEKNPNKIKTSQNKNEKNIEKFLAEFPDKYKQTLQNIFANNMYIPQEVYNAEVAKNEVKK